MLTRSLVALACVSLAHGFGGVQHVQQHVPLDEALLDDAVLSSLDACSKCACEYDPGLSEESVPETRDKSCCNVNTWDGFCDGLTTGACQDACSQIDQDVEVADLFRETQTGLKSKQGLSNPYKATYYSEAGGFCGHMRSYLLECVDGLTCDKSKSEKAKRRARKTGICISPVEKEVEIEIVVIAPTQAQEYAQKLKDAGVKLVAWDFDLTALTHHTHREMFESYSYMASLISPDFADMAVALFEAGVHQAIVSYNSDGTVFVGSELTGGVDLIKNVLGLRFSAELMDVLPIFSYNSGQTDRPGQLPSGQDPHLNEAQTAHGGIANDATLLVDDTTTNIEVAVQKGYFSVLVNPRDGFSYANVDRYLRPPRAPTSNSGGFNRFG